MMFLAAFCVFAVSAVSAQVGPSGIVSSDGKNVQFSHEFANNIVLIGPSGIVTKNGKNLQLTDAQVFPNGGSVPPTPVASFVSQRGVVGPSGIVSPTGRNTQFTHEEANNIVLVGPSGIVTKNGKNLQFNDDLTIANRQKRSVGFVSQAGNVGTSGILRADGTTDLFDFNTAHNILLIGPSGIVMKDGRNIQFTQDLNIVPRAKRSLPLIGPSGMITKSGQQIQFRTGGATILLEGPSGYVFSDGTLVQKTL